MANETKTPMPVNPTPKLLFQSSGLNISAHKKLVESNDFTRAIETAKAHYFRILNDTSPRDLNAPT